MMLCLQLMMVTVIPHHHHHHHVCLLQDQECTAGAHSASGSPVGDQRCESCCITKFHALRLSQEDGCVQKCQTGISAFLFWHVKPLCIEKTAYITVEENLFASSFCRMGGCRAPPVV